MKDDLEIGDINNKIASDRTNICFQNSCFCCKLVGDMGKCKNRQKYQQCAHLALFIGIMEDRSWLLWLTILLALWISLEAQGRSLNICSIEAKYFQSGLKLWQL